VVKVDKAMYGLIESSKLWYKELVVILHVDYILVLSELSSDRYWVKEILGDRYEKVTNLEGSRLPYLGMTIIKLILDMRFVRNHTYRIFLLCTGRL
jgi:hypothetical protein